MASGDGIDSIELESTISNNRNNAEYSSTARTSDDNEHASGIDGRSTTNQEFPGDITQINRPGHRYAKVDKERKIGHRRVGEGGEITYKKIQTSQIMGSIQLGIQHTVGSLASKPKRDLLMMDFWEIESISFPPEGSSLTPAHHYSEFRFKIYAPIAFRYFRDLFGIQPDDFMMSMCSSPLRELSNPGASGSIFYLTDDDEFIIKTVQHKEGEFLQKLLPGYYMNLNQNPRTLLPKFFGLYCFQCNSKNVRLVVMNNLLPSYIKMHLKYDLKGSTYKRKANKVERGKSSPTYKDLDFIEHHPNGIFLEADTYNALIKTIQRDCTVLESFKIMDYSLLVGVHNLDLAFKEKQEERKNNLKQLQQQQQQQQQQQIKSPRQDYESDLEDAPEADQYIALEKDREEREKGGGGTGSGGATALNRSRSINRQRLVAHSTAMESIQAESEPIDEEEDVPPGGIPARSEKGERLLLFIGIIDILQSYRLKKKLEHTFKSIIHDGDTVSVCRPSFYAQRFQNFMAKTVFKKIPSLDLPEIKGNHRKFRTLVSSYIALKHSPSKRKSLSRVAQRSTEADADSHPVAGSSHHHHSGSSSQKPASIGAPVTTTNQQQSVVTTSTTTTATTNNNNKTLSTTNKPNSSNLSLLTNLPLSTITKQQQQQQQKPLQIAKSKVPPPVPPRGSPKTRKSQTNNNTKTGNISAKCSSPTGSIYTNNNNNNNNNNSSNNNNINNNNNVIINDHKNTLQINDDDNIPKFGERLSPSNVRDWLEINDFSKIDNNTIIINDNDDHHHHQQHNKSIDIFPTNKIDILQKNLRRSSLLSTTTTTAHKRDYFKRQNSFLSQSERSTVGSIVQMFPPITPEYIPKPPQRKRNDKKKFDHKKYFDYIDMAIGDNGEDDNLMTSLSSFVEVKKDIETKLIKKKLSKRQYLNDTTTTTATHQNGMMPSVTTATTTTAAATMVMTTRRKSRLNRTFQNQTPPSIIMEDYCQTSSLSDLNSLQPDLNIIKRKKSIIKTLTNLNPDSDDSIIDGFSLDGEFV